MAYRLKKKFAFYYIKQLLDSNFNKKIQKSRTLIPTSSTGPSLSGNLAAPAPFALLLPTSGLSAPALFVLPSPTLGPSAPALTNIPIYATQVPDTEITFEAYIQPSGPTFTAYI